MNPRTHAGASVLSTRLHRIFGRPSVFKLGRNAWRVAHANQVAFCIDADEFFRAFAQAAAGAKRQILILGWDTDSRLHVPASTAPSALSAERLPADDSCEELGDFLARLARDNPELKIHLLSWDFAFIYLLEREELQPVRFSRISHERFRFVLDREHPFLASHHQKIVVIDDEVAFSGGLDLTARRWDTSEHLGSDSRRIDPWGVPYGPFHDVQICVRGEAARCLGDLARERWNQATGENLVKPAASFAPAVVEPPWPVSVRTAMRDVKVAISRTIPAGTGRRRRAVIEVERLFLDMIRTAKKWIYIENQYFTSPRIAQALARRLREADGPEVVMILPRDQTGWIEETTMGILRSKAIRLVEDDDLYHRFRCFYPIVPDLGEGYVKVHSKVMIIDDEIVRVGSANLNQRSMGLDTECDLSIEAKGMQPVASAISDLRARLLSEHLGADKEKFNLRLQDSGSLIETIESFRGGPRDFVPIRPETAQWPEKVVLPRDWIDPSGPHGFRRWMIRKISQNRHSLASLLIFAVLLGLLVLSDVESRQGYWAIKSHPTPLADFIHRGWTALASFDGHKIAQIIDQVRANQEFRPFLRPLVLIGFVVGSFLFIPISAMILAVVLTFSRPEAIVLAASGAALAALATYGLGRYWAWSKSRYLTRPWIQRLSRKITHGGVLTITLIRMTPIAPFTAVSIVAGGLRIPIRAYMAGSILGILPGIVVLTVVSEHVLSRARQADWEGALAVALSAFILLMVSRHLLRRRRSRAV